VLAEQGGPGAIEILWQVLHNPDPSVRLMVLASIVHRSQDRSLLQEASGTFLRRLWLEQAVSIGR
jgi:hypothetical protein